MSNDDLSDSYERACQADALAMEGARRSLAAYEARQTAERVSGEKKTVSERALMARINKALEPEGEVLHKAREWSIDTRNYYCVDVRRNAIESAHDDLEKLARDLGVLGEDEALES